MRPGRPPPGRGVRTLALAAAVAAGLGSCASSHPPRRFGASNGVTRDIWDPPRLSGPPSAAKFCKLLVYQYEHIAELPRAANPNVRRAIVRDYVSFTPTVVAAAPPRIAGAASTYLDAVAKLLAELNGVDLNAARLPKGELGPLLLSPSVRSASQQVLSFADQRCHYAIG